jgi:hypothetical protein
MHDLTLEHEWNDGIVDITPRCSQCHSVHIETRDIARRLGGAIGVIAGTTGGMALALAGTELGLLAGPVGAVMGCITGLIIDGIVGGATGCAAGCKLGTAIDQNILRNQRCRDCGHTFSNKSS